jgi:hypothetical protein
VTTLQAPDVLECYFDGGFSPHLAAMHLRWPPCEDCARVWKLPRGVILEGLPPARFGLNVERHGADAYAVCLLWGDTAFRWQDLSRAALLGSALVPVLAALGGNLPVMLEQPVVAEGSTLSRVA